VSVGGDHSADDSTEPVLARRVLEAVATAGVRHIFGLPGVHNLAFWRETGSDLPRIVGVRHEQTTVYAADGLARASGGLGVALTTTGPGAANAAGAFGEAGACGSPVLLIASEISTALARPGVRRGLLHESRDQAAIFEPLAKAVFRPRTVADVVRDVGAAISVALAFPRGPVYLDIPTDLLNQPAPPVTFQTQPTRQAPAAADVDQVVAAITAARDIVLWVGGGVVQSGAADEVRVLAEALNASVVTTFSARGVLPAGHPCLVGMPPHEPEVAELIAAADLMIGLGTDFDGMMTRNWTMPVARRLVNINCDPVDLTKNYQPDIAVLADVSLAIAAVLKALPDADGRGPSTAATLGARVRSRLSDEAESADAVRLLDSIEQATGPGTVVLADMAIPGYWVAGYAAVRAPRTLQYPMGWGTLGYALPAAVGAASLGAPVLVVCGDGGFMFGVAELAAIVQEQLPVVVLLVDDGGYGMLRYDQQRAGDPSDGVDLTRPDFVALAAAFGITGESVSDPGRPLATALAAALGSGAPRLVLLETALTPPRTTSPRWRD
jgi:thiamine pyrophosphate-dependent acetolactate synthase large subunit-like protein